jgi:hypothetical protein
MRIRSVTRPAAAVLLALLVVGVPGIGVPAGASGSPPSDPTVIGARWLADQLTPDGYVEGLFAPGPDSDATRDVAFTLAATGLERGAFDSALAWLTANVEDVIAPDGEPEEAGTMGYLIMLAIAVGDDPRDFGGVDLIARLEATYGTYEDGLYGPEDPTFDGVLRQSLALLAFRAAGVAPWPEAIIWLQNQQCDAGASDPASVGGFPAYRDPSEPCPAPSVSTYSGAETDATAVALQYLAGEGLPGASEAATFLLGVQSAGGGFPWYVGDADSPNSTALAIGGLRAAGEQGAADAAIAWLVDQQLGCDTPDPTAVGAFTSNFSDGGPDQFATRQAVLGVAGVTLPLRPTVWETTTSTCATEPTTPTTAPAPTTTTSPSAAPVTPRYTG